MSSRNCGISDRKIVRAIYDVPNGVAFFLPLRIGAISRDRRGRGIACFSRHAEGWRRPRDFPLAVTPVLPQSKKAALVRRPFVNQINDLAVIGLLDLGSRKMGLSDTL